MLDKISFILVRLSEGRKWENYLEEDTNPGSD